MNLGSTPLLTLTLLNIGAPFASINGTIGEWIPLPPIAAESASNLAIHNGELIIEHTNPDLDLVSSNGYDWHEAPQRTIQNTRYQDPFHIPIWSQTSIMETVWTIGAGTLVWSHEEHNDSRHLPVYETSIDAKSALSSESTRIAHVAMAQEDYTFPLDGRHIDGVTLDRSERDLTIAIAYRETRLIDNPSAPDNHGLIETTRWTETFNFPEFAGNSHPWPKTGDPAMVLIGEELFHLGNIGEAIGDSLPGWQLVDAVNFNDLIIVLTRKQVTNEDSETRLFLALTPHSVLPRLPLPLSRMELDGGWRIQLNPIPPVSGIDKLPDYIPLRDSTQFKPSFFHYLAIYGWTGHARHEIYGDSLASQYPWIVSEALGGFYFHQSDTWDRPTFFWKPDIGWLETRTDWYPFLRSYLTNQWIWIDTGENRTGNWYLQANSNAWALIEHTPSEHPVNNLDLPWLAAFVESTSRIYPIGEGITASYFWNDTAGFCYAENWGNGAETVFWSFTHDTWVLANLSETSSLTWAKQIESYHYHTDRHYLEWVIIE